MELKIEEKFDKMEENIQELDIDVGPILYGMDRETAINIKKKQSSTKAQEDIEEALDWIETMTGEPCDDVYESLKSGVVLCRLINVLRPGAIPKIDMRNSVRFGPAVARENIKIYLEKCSMMGVPRADLFNVSDLYEQKNLDAVVRNILALKRQYSHKTPAKAASLRKKPDVVINIPEEAVPPTAPKRWTRSKIIAAGFVTAAVVAGCYITFSDSEMAQSIRHSLLRVGNVFGF